MISKELSKASMAGTSSSLEISMTILGERNSEDLAAGHQAIGHRHCNDDYMRDFVSEDRFIATNTFRKHKGCHITTFEQERENPTIFFETECFLVRQYRKYSIRITRSFINQHVGTDQRLVTAYSKKMRIPCSNN